MSRPYRSSSPSTTNVRSTPGHGNRPNWEIDWTNVPFTAETTPDGQWRMNQKGDTYLKCEDGSYHYVNTDSSYYFSDDASGRKTYTSPRGEKFFTPGAGDLAHGEYFIGRDWQTQVENIYWEYANGRLIIRALRKNVTDETVGKLSWDWVAVGDNFQPQIVDNDGRPIVRRVKNKTVFGREDERRRERLRSETSQPWKASQVTVVDSEPDGRDIGERRGRGALRSVTLGDIMVIKPECDVEIKVES